MKRKEYIAPLTLEHQIKSDGVLMSSFGPSYFPTTPVTPP
jgi:hypothetical protein